MDVLIVEPHWEILDEKRIEFLHIIADNIRVPDCYMGGGTALSLQMGLRKSVDFDFFTPVKFEPTSLFAVIQDNFRGCEMSEINVSGGTCDVNVDGVQMSWFYHPYAILKPQVKLNGISGLTLASPNEIAAMKVSAIGGRGAKKDFFDLYYIMTRTNMTAGDLADNIYEKFGINHNYTHMCMGLTYFEDAEHEPLNNVFVDYDWNEIKQYYNKLQPKLIKEMQNKSVEHNLKQEKSAKPVKPKGPRL